MTKLGDRLFETVSRYHGFGVHQGGSEVDAATAHWMADCLREAGMTVDVRSVPFDRYSCDSTLTVDGQEMEHLVVPYSWTGRISSNTPWTGSFDPKRGGFGHLLEAPAAEAMQSGADCAVVATEHPNGSLVGVNRHDLSPLGLPLVLVAGRDLDRISRGPVELSVEASIVAGQTFNVEAHNPASLDGSPVKPLLMVTPLTGWFGCAGERGCGVAMLQHLVKAMADTPIMALGTGAHELGFIGVSHWLETATADPSAIVHLGASLAVLEPGDKGQLATTRIAMTSLEASDATPIAAALAEADLNLVTEPTAWVGEAQVLQRLGLPMLSLSGAGIDFHTPEDTPERATSPDALATVAKSMVEAAEAFDVATRVRIDSTPTTEA